MASGPKKLRIGFLFDDTLDSNDGVAQYVKRLGAWLSSQGHDVSYLVGETKLETWAGGKVFSLAQNVPVIFNGNRLSIPLPARRGPIKSLLKNHSFDVLHVMMPHSPLMSQMVINRTDTKTAVVGTFHILPSGVISRLGSRVLRLLYGRGLRHFDKVLSVSSASGDFALKSFGINTKVMPNVVDLKRFRPASQHRVVNDHNIVFLGRLVPRKGAGALLKAFAILHKANPGLKLIIAGDGPERSNLERYVAKNNLAGAVKFLGYIKEEDKPKILASAQIACFPSFSGEAFGIVLIEAMAAGAGVVIGGDNPGYRSVLGGQPQLLVDAKDTKRLAKRIQEFLDDKDLARNMHIWQQKHVEQYDTPIVGNQILAVYRQAIAKRQAGRHN